MNVNHPVITDALHCAQLFRLGRDIEAALKMVDLVDMIVPEFASRPASQQAQLAHVMSTILACQERQDWLGVADTLAYELTVLVRACQVD
jgi:hypothetical protein